jgi:hypothetical protein
MVSNAFQPLDFDLLSVDGAHVSAPWGMPHDVADGVLWSDLIADGLERSTAIVEGPLDASGAGHLPELIADAIGDTLQIALVIRVVEHQRLSLDGQEYKILIGGIQRRGAQRNRLAERIDRLWPERRHAIRTSLRAAVVDHASIQVQRGLGECGNIRIAESAIDGQQKDCPPDVVVLQLGKHRLHVVGGVDAHASIFLGLAECGCGRWVKGVTKGDGTFDYAVAVSPAEHRTNQGDFTLEGVRVVLCLLCQRLAVDGEVQRAQVTHQTIRAEHVAEILAGGFVFAEGADLDIAGLIILPLAVNELVGDVGDGDTVAFLPFYWTARVEVGSLLVIPLQSQLGFAERREPSDLPADLGNPSFDVFGQFDGRGFCGCGGGCGECRHVREYSAFLLENANSSAIFVNMKTDCKSAIRGFESHPGLSANRSENPDYSGVLSPSKDKSQPSGITHELPPISLTEPLSGCGEVVARMSGKRKPRGDFKTYFIQGQQGGNIKIGVALSPEDRLRDLQCGSPVPLVLLAFINSNKESELHQLFAEDRAHGEWFRPSAQLLRFIGHPSNAQTRLKRAKPDIPEVVKKRVMRIIGGEWYSHEAVGQWWLENDHLFPPDTRCKLEKTDKICDECQTCSQYMAFHHLSDAKIDGFAWNGETRDLYAVAPYEPRGPVRNEILTDLVEVLHELDGADASVSGGWYLHDGAVEDMNLFELWPHWLNNVQNLYQIPVTPFQEVRP